MNDWINYKKTVTPLSKSSCKNKFKYNYLYSDNISILHQKDNNSNLKDKNYQNHYICSNNNKKSSSFTASGIGCHSKKSWKKACAKINITIDLHGHTLINAKNILYESIVISYQNNYRMVLIISGKGKILKKPFLKKNNISNDNVNTNTNTIRSMIPEWLNNLSYYIVRYSQANKKHGGSGAWYVYLRQKK
ncbi:Smr/MutS family protein [Lyticum sinuosum]|uniref:Smr/MutS family protein n=1 Tax=Lyticum sinuosum TaxID=1332059 RepID=A0AAE4VLX7_9RICK|nr:Smr/MutS family protein [Lyticum sinuosum]MDZ5760944.1 Smr/MutS family protein [Lyticum sinuosum]